MEIAAAETRVRIEFVVYGVERIVLTTVEGRGGEEIGAQVGTWEIAEYWVPVDRVGGIGCVSGVGDVGRGKG